MAHDPEKRTLAPRPPSGEEVAAYLRSHPDFLARRPELLTGLELPSAERADGAIDLQRYLLERLRGEVERLRSEQAALIGASRDNLSGQSRIHRAVLALLDAPSFEHFIQAVTGDLAPILAIDVVTLSVESADAGPRDGAPAGIRLLPSGTVDAFIGARRSILLVADEPGDRRIFGGGFGQVRSSALLRITPGGTAPVGLLALGSRHPDTFHPGQGTELLAFLARVLESSIRAWLNLTD